MSEQIETRSSSPRAVDADTGSDRLIGPPAAESDPPLARHRLLLLAILCSLLGVTLVTYQLARSAEGVALRTQAQADSAQLAQLLQEELSQELDQLRRLRHRQVNGHIRTDEELAALAQSRLHRWSMFELIAGVDQRGACQWVRAKPTSEPLPSLDLAGDPQWGPILSSARSNRRETAGASRSAGGERADLDIAVPMVGQAKSGEKTTILIGRLKLDRALNTAINEHLRREYNIELRDERGPILVVGPLHGVGKGYGNRRTVPIANTQWRLHLWPTDATVKARMERMSQMVLWGGLAGSLLFTGAMWRVMVYRTREIQQTRSHLQALESLNRITTAISAKLGSGREVLEQLADSARHLLGMSRSGIGLLEEQNLCLRIYAYSGDVSAQARTTFMLENEPAARACIETGRVLFVEDASHRGMDINEDTMREFNAAAVILIPLRVEGRCIGLMALSDLRPRRFTDAERRLAKLLGSQASVILANNRLYEQTRRDAQTHAVLLRELHHRVKNNLAGIVGLLSMNEPDLSLAARQWLDRVIERIQTMARTQDLFSGGMDHIGIQQLIEQVLPSLSVIKPPGVVIQSSADGVRRKLAASQAVSLAMVLHELCSNAIQHGLKGQARGTLWIEANESAEGMTIEVIDDGCGLPAGVCKEDGDNPMSGIDLPLSESNDVAFRSRCVQCESTPVAVGDHGLGLRLVRELVGRELRGRLRLRCRPGGGTIATVEMPRELDVEGAVG